jgi:integrase
MTNKLATQKTNALAAPSILEQAGQAANQAASAGIFTDYQDRKSENTLRRHKADLARFVDFLNFAGVICGDLITDPEAWQGVTWGLIKGFANWQLQNGYAIGTINGRLSTVKVYAKLAALAGVIDPSELALIQSVRGFEHKERKHINDKRKAAGIDTRKGAKKAHAVSLAKEQAEKLLDQDTQTDQGRRDRLLLAIMLRLGLRVGELAALQVGDFDLKAGELRFYRPKVDKTQTHKLDAVTLDAARDYITQDAPALGIIWRGSVKGQGLAKQGMSERAITKRVKFLGAKVGAVGLSAHDLRHYWATQAARNGTALDRLQDAGGWSSLAMPGRYIEAAKIANQGVRLD